MSALTSSIGHELGQPLGSIMHNAQALQMMVTANRATSDTIGRDPVRHPDPGRPRHADHRSPSDDAQKPSAGQETDRSARRHRGDPCPRRARHERAAGRDHRRSVFESVRHQRRSGALAAGVREPRDERDGRDGRHTAGPASCHDQQRRQGRRCRRLRARHGTGRAGSTSSTRCSPPSSRRKRAASGSA